MRRAGQNPTDVEVHDMINKIDNGSGVLDFEDFLLVMGEKNRETDIEIHFKDTFRAFSKDEDGEEETVKVITATTGFFPGCIPAEELKFVMNHLPGEVSGL